MLCDHRSFGCMRLVWGQTTAIPDAALLGTLSQRSDLIGNTPQEVPS